MLLKEFRLIPAQPGLVRVCYRPLGSERLTAAAWTTTREQTSCCETNLAGTWYWLWQIKCCWQRPLCSTATLLWHIAQSLKHTCQQCRCEDEYVYLNPSRWKPCTACCMMDLVFWFEILFLYALMKMVPLRTLWNEPIICMFSTVWTKRFYPLHPKFPRVFSLFQALVLSVVAS